MNYCIADIVWLRSHGIEPLPEQRKSKDGTKVLIHQQMLMGYGLEKDIKSYSFSSPELKEILESDDWSTADLDDKSRYLSRLSALDQINKEQSQVINTVELADEEALQQSDRYPIWGDPNGDAAIGKPVSVNFKCRLIEGSTSTLYKCITSHVIQESWKPGIATLSLWQPVASDPTSGTFDNPIKWEVGMEIISGKYYSENGNIYYGLRDSKQGMPYTLDVLAQILWVELVTEPKQEEGGSGTIDDPYVYVKNKTSLVRGKYYIEDGITYLALQDSGPIIYDLIQVPALAQKAEQGEPEVPEPEVPEPEVPEPEVPEPEVPEPEVPEPEVPEEPGESEVTPDGTIEKPFPYVKGETSIQVGYFYSENGVVYECIQPSGSMPYDLSQVPALAKPISGNSEVPEPTEPEVPEPTEPEVPEPTPSEPGDSKDNPIDYIPGTTALIKDKYYRQYGQTYLCIQNGNVQIYDLSVMPAIVTLV